MDPYRTNKLNHAILEVLSDLLQAEVKDPRVGFVTLGGVKLNRDHSVAEVFFSVMGEGADPELTLHGLKKARGYLQGRVARTLGIRSTPELRFVYDESLERGMALDGLLEELKDKGEFMSDEQKRRQMDLDDLLPPSDLIESLRACRSVWVVPHHNPDPDATGSALALGAALAAMGRRVRVLGYPDAPVGLVDLPGFADILSSDDAAAAYADDAPDTVVLVDCHRIDRTGPLEETLARCENRLTIDHHMVSGRRAPEPGWIEARACSTCTLVHQVIEALADGDEPFELSLDMATNLYAGLVNDTGGFRFANTAPFSFELARRLASLGVDTAQVAAQTLHRYRRQGVELMQRVLATFTYHDRGRILVLHATQAMLRETGGSMPDTEGFVNIATAVDGVKYVVFLKDLGDNSWRASLRVRGDGDVQVVAARYGGGGHRAAAGCTIEGALEDVAAGLVQQLTSAPTA